MKKFDIPVFYRSTFISEIKQLRAHTDPRKKDFSPTLLDFGRLHVYIARHFGFCYGVENAIEIAYKALEENPGKCIFLLSQMIHNPHVNENLEKNGIRFILDTQGKQLFPWEELRKDDVVLIPAFGTTLETEKKLQELGISTEKYNTTCPFVEKVWKKSAQLGNEDYTVVIHGKHLHEETRATFSHSKKHAPSVVVKDVQEAGLLADVMLNKLSAEDFFRLFEGRYSEGFHPNKDLHRVGVVNQTTMLATETQQIADLMRETMKELHGEKNLSNHYADTRDTLCYATNDNQVATYALLHTGAHLAIVVGGYNSSNTSHIVELCEEKMPTYFIHSAEDILSEKTIQHYHLHTKSIVQSNDYLPTAEPLKLVLTSGASCPDATVEAVLDKLLQFFPDSLSKDLVLEKLKKDSSVSVHKNRQGR